MILLIKLLIVDEPVINVIFKHTKPKNEIAIIDGKIQNLSQKQVTEESIYDTSSDYSPNLLKLLYF